MSNLGVFHWIRDAVRRSVLLGFSDAVEQLGAPTDQNEALHPQLMAALKSVPTNLASTATIERPSKGERKRLGRSLEQFRQPGKPLTE